MACTRPLNAYQTPSGKVLFTPHPDSTFIQLARPHYHLVLFNHDFYDKVLFKSGKFPLFISDTLRDLWPHGHSVLQGINSMEAAKNAFAS